MNLTLFLIIPMLTVLVALFSRGLPLVRWITLAGATVQLVMSFILLALYWQQRSSGNTSPMLFEYALTWFAPLHIAFHVGVDGISVAMILLTAFIMEAAVLVAWRTERMGKEFLVLLSVMGAGAYGFFISLDLFTLFFFLEVSVIPKFLLIGIWGSNASNKGASRLRPAITKEYSALKLALMLMAGSALVFVGMLGLYYFANPGTHTFDMLAIGSAHMPLSIQRVFFPLMFIGFGIFTALFPFHTWVPDGHSAAPTPASMFLAGISMKLGGYGCIRVATILMPDAAREYAPVIILLSVIAIVYGAFATMMQKDLKYINAYSSISHCGFVLLGIGMLTNTSVTGAVMQMVSHGLMTALLFAAIGMIYDRTHTRQVEKLGGLLKIMPFVGTVFVIGGLCSLGLPGLSGFAAEITVFMGSWQNAGEMYRLATILACASIVITAVYILRAVGQTIMGPVRDAQFSSLPDAAWNEKVAAALLVAGIVAIGIAPFWLSRLASPGTIVHETAKMIFRK